MKKITKIILHLIETERNLAEQIVKESFDGNPNAVLTNAAHTEVSKLLEFCYSTILEGQPCAPKPVKTKLHLVKKS